MGFFSRKSKTKITDSAMYYQCDLANLIKEKSNGGIDISQDWTVSLTVESDMLNKLDDKGIVDVLQEMVDDAQKATELAADEIINVWRSQAEKHARGNLTADQQLEIMSRMTNSRSRFNSRSQSIVSKLKTQLSDIPDKRWARFKQVKKEYRNYKIKSGVKVAATSAGIGASVASTALSVPTGGASIALTVIGLQRSVLSLAMQVRDLSQQAETVFEGLISDIETLEQSGHVGSQGNGHSRHRVRKHHSGRSQGKTNLRMREVGANTMQAVTGGYSPTASIKGCKDAFDLLDNKTKGLVRKSNQFASKINELIYATEKLNADLTQRGFGQSKSIKVRKTIEANEKALDATLIKCVEVRERWNLLSQKMPLLNRRIQHLNSKAGKNFVRGAAFIPVLTDIGLAAWGNVDSFSGAAGSWDYVQSSLTCSMDLISAGLDVKGAATA